MEAPVQTISFCDPDGFPQFVATVLTKNVVSIEFEVQEVMGFTEGDKAKPIFEGEVYLRAIIKWDGCSHVYFGNEGYLHLCGKRAWERHAKMMEWLYKSAPEVNEAFSKEEAWI